jgi:hypothetical protein
MLTNGNMWDAFVGKSVISVQVREMISADDEKVIPITFFIFDDGSTFCFSADVNDRDSYYAYLAEEGSFEEALSSRSDPDDPDNSWRWFDSDSI